MEKFISSGSTLIVDGTSIDSGEHTLDGVTAGTVSASKTVIVDANKDITGFRNVSLSADASFYLLVRTLKSL